VLDFGLVKPRDAEAAELTADQVVTGTPAFMAPEQVLGERQADARSDLYALGCVAYWLFTGQYVFDGANAIQIMMEHVRGTPLPPSQRTELPITPELDQLVLACLEKDPANRPQSADELSDALACAWTNGSWTQERAHQWWALHGSSGAVEEPLAPGRGLRPD
jgi:serine/threonine-protein kinase